ncbi:cell division topological specificity factor [Synergistales bacterium]|nr:cell division topological specificity factor [Synergistales bacterium]
MGIFSSLFSSNSSGKVAKDRLQLVLVHDRTDISAELMEQMRNEIISVIMKYVEIDESRIELGLEHEENSVALVANIPVTTVIRRKRGTER